MRGSEHLSAVVRLACYGILRIFGYAATPWKVEAPDFFPPRMGGLEEERTSRTLLERARDASGRLLPRLVDRPYGFSYAHPMKTVTATEARRTLYRLLDEVAVTSEPVQITGRRKGAVLVSEDDWRSIEETLHLLSIPGMRESIREGMETPLEECVEELDW
jgi:antitoxin YefM